MLRDASATGTVAGAVTLTGAGVAVGIPAPATGTPGPVLASEAPALDLTLPVAPVLTLLDALVSPFNAPSPPLVCGAETDRPEVEGDVPFVREPRSGALLTDAGTTIHIPALVPASV